MGGSEPEGAIVVAVNEQLKRQGKVFASLRSRHGRRGIDLDGSNWLGGVYGQRLRNAKQNGVIRRQAGESFGERGVELVSALPCAQVVNFFKSVSRSRVTVRLFLPVEAVDSETAYLGCVQENFKTFTEVVIFWIALPPGAGHWTEQQRASYYDKRMLYESCVAGHVFLTEDLCRDHRVAISTSSLTCFEKKRLLLFLARDLVTWEKYGQGALEPLQKSFSPIGKGVLECNITGGWNEKFKFQTDTHQYQLSQPDAAELVLIAESWVEAGFHLEPRFSQPEAVEAQTDVDRDLQGLPDYNVPQLDLASFQQALSLIPESLIAIVLGYTSSEGLTHPSAFTHLCVASTGGKFFIRRILYPQAEEPLGSFVRIWLSSRDSENILFYQRVSEDLEGCPEEFRRGLIKIQVTRVFENEKSSEAVQLLCEAQVTDGILFCPFAHAYTETTKSNGLAQVSMRARLPTCYRDGTIHRPGNWVIIRTPLNGRGQTPKLPDASLSIENEKWLATEVVVISKLPIDITAMELFELFDKSEGFQSLRLPSCGLMAPEAVLKFAAPKYAQAFLAAYRHIPVRDAAVEYTLGSATSLHQSTSISAPHGSQSSSIVREAGKEAETSSDPVAPSAVREVGMSANLTEGGNIGNSHSANVTPPSNSAGEGLVGNVINGEGRDGELLTGPAGEMPKVEGVDALISGEGLLLAGTSAMDDVNGNGGQSADSVSPITVRSGREAIRRSLADYEGAPPIQRPRFTVSDPLVWTSAELATWATQVSGSLDCGALLSEARLDGRSFAPLPKAALVLMGLPETTAEQLRLVFERVRHHATGVSSIITLDD